MPRSGPARGYDSAHVCAFCIELLNGAYLLSRPTQKTVPIRASVFLSTRCYTNTQYSVTSLGRPQLRSLPIAKLRRYIAAYNISVKNPVDKNDLIDAAVAARVCFSMCPFPGVIHPFIPIFADLPRLSLPRQRGLL